MHVAPRRKASARLRLPASEFDLPRNNERSHGLRFYQPRGGLEAPSTTELEGLAASARNGCCRASSALGRSWSFGSSIALTKLTACGSEGKGLTFQLILAATTLS